MRRTLKNIEINLSRFDQEFISIGLTSIVCAYQSWCTFRSWPHCRPDSSWMPVAARGVYDQPMMDSLLALRRRLQPMKPRRRLRFHGSFELAACLLAVRVALRLYRHGHIKPVIAQYATAAARLSRRLENARRRLKRSELKRLGQNDYQDVASRWRNFVTCLRVHFLDCRCTQKRRPIRAPYRRQIIDRFVQWAREELIDRGEPVLPEPELRREVRLAVSYVRRGRRRYTLGDMLHDRVFASARLANFITIRKEKLKGGSRTS
jgi:hypothetical protein